MQPDRRILDPCCPPHLCSIDPCKLICNFVNLLPSGPLWDEAKMQALELFQEGTCIDDVWVEQCRWDNKNLCVHLVRHSVYTALRLYDALLNALWPALRESDPFTAYDTMDDWLDKFGWQNCFESACRDIELGPGLTPLELTTICGAQYCAPDYPECLQTTIKHLLLMVLARMQIGLHKTVADINALIAPLGARIRVDLERAGECPNAFIIEPTTDTFNTWQRMNCLPPENLPCLAYYEPNKCFQTGLPQRIYPGVLAAECIVRSLLLGCGLINFDRRCEVGTDDSGMTSVPNLECTG